MSNSNQPSEAAKTERVSKLIARAGLASRRGAEEMIGAGRVAINGHFVTEQGIKADPEKDKITVDGTLLKFEDKPPIVVVLHKPKYTITTRDDPENRPTVFDLLPHKFANLHPVGRLDFETSGVLLLTDDGTLTHLLTHPSHGVEKIYEARARGEVSKETLEHLERGVKLEDGLTAPCRARVLAQRDKNALVEITLREGRNRQARRMMEAVGHAASSLRRVYFAGVELEGMAPGEHRELFPVEIKKLRRVAQAGLKAKSRPRSRPKPHPRGVAPEDAEPEKPARQAQPHARMSRSNNGRAQSARAGESRGEVRNNARNSEGRSNARGGEGRSNGAMRGANDEERAGESRGGARNRSSARAAKGAATRALVKSATRRASAKIARAKRVAIMRVVAKRVAAAIALARIAAVSGVEPIARTRKRRSPGASSANGSEKAPSFDGAFLRRQN